MLCTWVVYFRFFSTNIEGALHPQLCRTPLIWNPGKLPLELNPEKLRHPHKSIPANPLLAEPMYLAGYIERMGTGTGDIIRLCREDGLKEPEFVQESDFRTIIWRTKKATGQGENELTGQANITDNKDGNKEPTGQATDHVSGQVAEPIKRLVLVMEDDLKRAEIQAMLGLRHRETFVLNYLNPSLESAYIEMTIPEIPTHKEQRYRLTAKGMALQKKLKKSKKRK